MEKNNENNSRKCDETKIKIEISSYGSLIEILGRTRSVLKVVGALLILVFTVFIGLAFVTISIKRIYPYNDIKTNAFGATTMQNEDVELTYWLFNTAELWANSGIKVEAGDVLTIRASGKSHTAIHHLVRDVECNNRLSENWSATDGRGRDAGRDRYRMNYRVFPDKPQDALIMQVVNDNDVNFSELNPKNLDWRYLTYKYVDNCLERMPEQIAGCIDYIRSNDALETSLYVINGRIDKEEFAEQRKQDFYFIGKERIDLHINRSGTLYFAVNDIILTHKAISAIITENDKMICDSVKQHKNVDHTDFVRSLVELRKSGKRTMKNPEYEKLWKKYNDEFFYLGNHPHQPKDSIYSGYNELTYYRDSNYYNAWFDDNVGSFLIVIERHKSK